MGNPVEFPISFCCPGRIRTLTGGTRIRRATITPQDILKTDAKVRLFFDSAKFSALFFKKNRIFLSEKISAAIPLKHP